MKTSFIYALFLAFVVLAVSGCDKKQEVAAAPVVVETPAAQIQAAQALVAAEEQQAAEPAAEPTEAAQESAPQAQESAPQETATEQSK